MGCAMSMLEPRLARWDRVFRSRWFLLVPIATVMLPLVQLVEQPLRTRSSDSDHAAFGNRPLASSPDRAQLRDPELQTSGLVRRHHLQPLPVAATLP